jgi:hypothetical protein
MSILPERLRDEKMSCQKEKPHEDNEEGYKSLKLRRHMSTYFIDYNMYEIKYKEMRMSRLYVIWMRSKLVSDVF